MLPSTTHPPTVRRSVWPRWVALAVLVAAVITRFHDLAGQSFWVDELHSLEFACGHGVDHQLIPTGRLLANPPDLTHVSTARPVWAVWTGMDRVSHPAAPYVLLRLWVDAFGESEAAVRSLSAVCSVGAVVGLFLAVRMWVGTEPAIWAAALMTFAGPQVHAGRDGRPYALAMLLATAALWAVGQTVRAGPSRGRTVALAAVLLGLLLTHYFDVAAVVAVGVYALGATRGPTRWNLLSAVGAAGVAFAVVWGPFMWRQSATFSTDDRSAAFLHEAGPGHGTETFRRLAALPVTMLADRRPIPTGYVWVGLAAYATAAVLTIRHRWSPMWALWFTVTVAMLAGLDLTRSTRHLNYVRYPLIAAPVVYVAIASLPALHRVAGRTVAAVTVGFAVWSLPLADLPPNADYRALADAVAARVPGGEPIVFAGPASRVAAPLLYLGVDHYAGPLTHPVMLLDVPATPATVAQLGSRPIIWMVADPDVRLARQWLPGYHLVAGQSWPVVGSVLRMERDGTKVGS